MIHYNLLPHSGHKVATETLMSPVSTGYDIAKYLITDRVSTGGNVIGSIRPSGRSSVRPSVSTLQTSDL